MGQTYGQRDGRIAVSHNAPPPYGGDNNLFMHFIHIMSSKRHVVLLYIGQIIRVAVLLVLRKPPRKSNQLFVISKLTSSPNLTECNPIHLLRFADITPAGTKTEQADPSIL